MKKAKGFTLIELVVVIVILGILAVTAAPKFLNLQDDARVATIKGLSGAMKSAASIVYGKSAILGIENLDSVPADDQVNIPGVGAVATKYGYPLNGETLELVVDGLETDDFDRDFTPDTAPTLPTGYTDAIVEGNVFGYDGFDCTATYIPAEDGVNGILPATVVVSGDVEGCEPESTTP